MKINIFNIPTTPEERGKRNKHVAFAIVSGLLFGLSFPPIPLPYLSFVALVPYLFILDERDGLGEINKYTYLFMFVGSLISLYWVGSWTADADTFLMVSGALLVFFNPILYLIPSTMFYMNKRVFGNKWALVLLPFNWVAFEYLYTLTEAHFPWLTLGNALPYFNSYIQIADTIGVYGLSLLILFANLFAFYSLRSYQRDSKIRSIYVAPLLMIIILPIIYGYYRTSSYEKSWEEISVGIVQPDFNPTKKWEAGNLDEQLDIYLSMSQTVLDNGAELIVWPETAMPVYLLSKSYESYVERIQKFVDENDVYVMTGMPHAEFFTNPSEAPPDAKTTINSNTKYVSYNSILLFKPDTTDVGIYGKIKLVPFGERIPFVDVVPFMGDIIKWNVGISSWNIGKDTVVFDMNNYSVYDKKNKAKVAGLVCFESIFPDFNAMFVQKGAELIVVVTNDSWYGDSSGPYQHKEIAVLRAVENRRAVVRCANGGVSCVINPLGITEVNTEMFTKDTFVHQAVLKNGLTFYTRNPFLIPYIVCTVLLLSLILFIGYKAKLLLNKKK